MLNSPVSEDTAPGSGPASKTSPNRDQDAVNQSQASDSTVHETVDDSQEAGLSPRVFPAEQITFEKGLIGFADHRDYGLMELPDERLAQFRLLQSIHDPDVSFLLLPLASEGGPIAPEDLDKALKNLGIDKEDAVILAIVTLHKTKDQFSATANIRAPIIINLKTRQGVQYVFANTAYAIRHPIN